MTPKKILVATDFSPAAKRLVLRGDASRLITAQLRKLKIDTLVIGKHTRRKRDAAAPYGSVCNHLRLLRAGGCVGGTVRLASDRLA